MKKINIFGVHGQIRILEGGVFEGIGGGGDTPVHTIETWDH